jgi:hypothetical protein
MKVLVVAGATWKVRLWHNASFRYAATGYRGHSGPRKPFEGQIYGFAA